MKTADAERISNSVKAFLGAQKHAQYLPPGGYGYQAAPRQQGSGLGTALKWLAAAGLLGGGGYMLWKYLNREQPPEPPDIDMSRSSIDVDDLSRRLREAEGIPSGDARRLARNVRYGKWGKYGHDLKKFFWNPQGAGYIAPNNPMGGS